MDLIETLSCAIMSSNHTLPLLSAVQIHCFDFVQRLLINLAEGSESVWRQLILVQPNNLSNHLASALESTNSVQIRPSKQLQTALDDALLYNDAIHLAAVCQSSKQQHVFRDSVRTEHSRKHFEGEGYD